MLALFTPGAIEGFFDYGLPIDGEQPTDEYLVGQVMALALLWAVSTGMWDSVHNATPDEEKRRTGNPATSCAA